MPIAFVCKKELLLPVNVRCRHLIDDYWQARIEHEVASQHAKDRGARLKRVDNPSAKRPSCAPGEQRIIPNVRSNVKNDGVPRLRQVTQQARHHTYNGAFIMVIP